MSNLKIHAQKRAWSRSIDVLLRDGGAVVSQLVLKQVEPGEWMEPSFSISEEAAQAFMDELWDCGFRPTNGSGSAGALSATEKHLEDMRRLVFEMKE